MIGSWLASQSWLAVADLSLVAQDSHEWQTCKGPSQNGWRSKAMRFNAILFATAALLFFSSLAMGKQSSSSGNITPADAARDCSIDSDKSNAAVQASNASEQAPDSVATTVH